MFIVTKRTSRSKSVYLGFDSDGHHWWTTDRLDAIRFPTEADAKNCCQSYLRDGAKVVKVNEWDGHYESHEDYEIQVFKDNLKGKPGGKRWRFRFAPTVAELAYVYDSGGRGYNTPEEAMNAARISVAKHKKRQHTAVVGTKT